MTIDPAPAQPDPLARRLRLGAFAVATFVVTAALTLAFATPGYEACRRHFGHDFLAFYVAGSLAREGRHAELYDLQVIRERQHAIAQSSNLALADDAVGPWWNPPVYAWPFAPLSRLPFGAAVAVWTLVNLATLAAALVLLCRLVPGHRGLTVALVICSAPFLQSLTHGQNTPISLMLVAAIATAWRGGRDFTAGALAGALMYKPQLAAAVAIVLVLHRGRRAAGGLVAVGAFLLVATAVTMPGALSDYFHRMPPNLHFMQAERTYLWERHVTLGAFWRLLFQGRGPGESSVLTLMATAATALPFAAGLLAAAWRSRRLGHPPDGLISATLLTAPLLMPFYFDYDLLLFAVPAIFAVRSRVTVAHWSGLYVALFVNPFLAPLLRLNLAVPLIACLATGTLLLASRRTTEATAAPVLLTPARPPLASSRKAA